MAVRAAMPSWFRLKMKLDPKANDRVRSSWRLRKSIPSSFRKERGPRHDTCADGVLGSVKTRFWAICRQSRSNPDGDMRVASVPGGRLVGSELRALHRSWTDYELSRTDRRAIGSDKASSNSSRNFPHGDGRLGPDSC